jgi:uncharacterized protein YjdB
MEFEMKRALLFTLVIAAAGCEGIYQRDITATVTGPSTVAVGSTVLLQCVLEYSDGTKSPLSPASASAVFWTSSNNAVATVDFFGAVTGVAKGEATITATPAPFSTDGKKTPGTHTITVQ